MADGRLHCSVHVVRLTVDPRSLSICYHEPPFKLDPQKNRVNGLSLVQGGDLGTVAALCGNPSRLVANNVGKSSTPKYLMGSLAAC